MKKLGNKAYSLIEVVVVVAIISIITAGSIFGVGALIGWKARQFADELVSVVREVKTDSMGKDAVVLVLSHDSDNYYSQKKISEYTVSGGALDKTTYSDTKTYEKNVLGKTNNLTVTITLREKEHFSDGSGTVLTYDLKSINNIAIGFERSSGSFKYVIINDDETYTKDEANNVKKMYLYSITVKQGSKEKVVRFEQLTGQAFEE